MRETRQRIAIRNALETQKRPLQIKEIQAIAQTECEGLGIATVYRTLRTMLLKKQVQKLELPGISTCYCIPRAKKTPLLICNRTRQIHWLEGANLNIDLPSIPENFEYQGHEVIVIGHFRKPAK